MAKQDSASRQAKIQAIQKQQKSSERRKGWIIIGVALVLGVGLIGAAAWTPISSSLEKREFSSQDLSSIGAPASACQDITTTPAGNDSGNHVEPGTPIDYTDSPPTHGPHHPSWAEMSRKFYTDDRPELGELVHNLEHGYTILWYDETIAEDPEQLKLVKGVAAKFSSDDNMRNKFKAVPWTAEDGDPFPEGQHVAFTHWSKGGAEVTEIENSQVGVSQFCSEVSGEALEKFMDQYPYLDSPEPLAG